MTTPRSLAAQIIDDVTNGRSLSDNLEKALLTLPDLRDRALVQAMCFGVCRYYTQLDVILGELLQKPMKAKDSDVHALLLVGLFQLKFMRLPDYAAVTETVNVAAKMKNKAWAKGFVNAILRSYQRQQEALEKVVELDDEARYAHPEWIIKRVKRDWPDQGDEVLHANNEHPPLTLRVNQKKISRDDYLKKLTEASIEAKPVPETKTGIILAEAVSIEKLPGFKQGEVFVQDAAPQLSVELLKLEDNMRVLDACSSPGGKLTHILEAANNIEAIAVEKDKKRIGNIHVNLTRMQLEAEVICADAADVKEWWDGKPFDRVLLDAPCSATGVIRRHPDIKLLRQPNDIAPLAREQRILLDALWPLVKPGGILLYATCSIFKQENEEVIEQFLKEHPDAVADKLDVEWGIPTEHGVQILPGMHGMDGFYYARLIKATSRA